MLLRVQVGLFTVFAAALGAVSSVLFFGNNCIASGVVSLVIYAPVVIAGILAHSFWRKMTLRIFIRTMIFCGFLSLCGQWACGVFCSFVDSEGNPKKNLTLEKWMPIIPTVLVFWIGARLIYKKIEDMDPNLTQRLSVQNHSFAIVFTFMWPIVLGFLWLTQKQQCTMGAVSFLLIFGVPALWSIGVQVRHNKFTRNSLGYLLIFLPGLVGWFVIPLAAINCSSFKLQSWIIFGCYPLFGLLSGSRFVKFYDVRHPEALPDGQKKEKDFGFITF